LGKWPNRADCNNCPVFIGLLIPLIVLFLLVKIKSLVRGIRKIPFFLASYFRLYKGSGLKEARTIITGARNEKSVVKIVFHAKEMCVNACPGLAKSSRQLFKPWEQFLSPIFKRGHVSGLSMVAAWSTATGGPGGPGGPRFLK
jgi:hypothetical protein